MGTKVVRRAQHREVGVLNTTWLLEHEVEHELHLEHRFSIAALACPVSSDIVHQFPELARPAVAGAKPQTFVVSNTSKLSQAEQLVPAKGYRFLAVTNEHIDVSELAARSVLLMHSGRLQLREADAKAMSSHINVSCATSHRWRSATPWLVTSAACRQASRPTPTRPSPRPATTGRCYGEV